jgi:hypothetical protein
LALIANMLLNVILTNDALHLKAIVHKLQIRQSSTKKRHGHSSALIIIVSRADHLERGSTGRSSIPRSYHRKEDAFFIAPVNLETKVTRHAFNRICGWSPTYLNLSARQVCVRLATKYTTSHTPRCRHMAHAVPAEFTQQAKGTCSLLIGTANLRSSLDIRCLRSRRIRRHE